MSRADAASCLDPLMYFEHQIEITPSEQKDHSYAEAD